MINLLQKSLDRRRIVKGGVAAGAAMAFNPFSGLVSAQEAEDLPTDASDMDALIAGAQEREQDRLLRDARLLGQSRRNVGDVHGEVQHRRA